MKRGDSMQGRDGVQRGNRVQEGRKNQLLGMVLIAAFLICGCGKKESAEPSDDTPWNNGMYAIMETENGYYSNLMYTQSLRFYEKESDTEIYLCGKPECPHDGRESCTATYRNLTTVNSVLYDGYIYILATEETEESVSYSLYRTAQDGSSLDKVGEVFRAEKTPEEKVSYGFQTPTGEPSAFIIHRGYAYIPFYVKIPKTFAYFAGGGIMKMDLGTGQTEQIYTMKLQDAPYPWDLAGCGDYIYYFVWNKKTGYYRYDTRDGSIVRLEDSLPEGYSVVAFTEDTLYALKNVYALPDEEEAPGWQIRAYDSETFEEKGLVLKGDPGNEFKVVPYEDKLFLYCVDRIEIYSKDGEKLGETTYDFPGFVSHDNHAKEREEPWHYRHEDMFFLKISQGKIYAILRYYPYFDQEKDCDVYACPIQDILDGKGEWTHVYCVKDLLGLTGEHYAGNKRECGHVYFEKGSVTVVTPVD